MTHTKSNLSMMTIPQEVKDLLERGGFLTADIIQCSSIFELQSKASLSLQQCKAVKQETSRFVYPCRISKASNISSRHRLSSGCSRLNYALRGGFPVDGLTELSGESGCGKTQLCLQLSLTVQWPKKYGGLEGGALYICTEDAFPSQRLQQLFKTFPHHAPEETKNYKYGDKIYVEHVNDAECLMKCLTERTPPFMNRHPIRLIVIDSVAGILRTEEGYNRTKMFRTLACQLSRLSIAHGCAVVCVNQVAQLIDKEETDEAFTTSQQVPALGLSWANLMHTRLKMNRRADGSRYIELKERDRGNQQGPYHSRGSMERSKDLAWHRIFVVQEQPLHGTSTVALSSPELPSGMECSFQVTSAGVVGGTS